MNMSLDADFAANVRLIFEQTVPQTVLETGTYNGLGSTTVFARTIMNCGFSTKIVGIEVNPIYAAAARANMAVEGFANITIWEGLSIRRDELPTKEEVERFLQEMDALNIPCDHPPQTRVESYMREIPEKIVTDNLLRTLIEQEKPDFILLDSAGHLGYLEFNATTETLQKIGKSAFVALDDILHVKHCNSLDRMMEDPRYFIYSCGMERNAWAIARFEPS